MPTAASLLAGSVLLMAEAARGARAMIARVGWLLVALLTGREGVALLRDAELVGDVIAGIGAFVLAGGPAAMMSARSKSRVPWVVGGIGFLIVSLGNVVNGFQTESQLEAGSSLLLFAGEMVTGLWMLSWAHRRPQPANRRRSAVNRLV